MPCAPYRVRERSAPGSGVYVSHDCHLLPELVGEDVLRDERVYTLHDINHLGHAKTHGNAAQSIRVELANLRLGGEELNRVARSESHCRMQIFVEAQSDPVRIGFCDRPSQMLLLMEEHLNLHLLHAGLDGGEADLAIALHRMAVARIDERSRLPHWYVECRSLGQLAEIKIARVWAGRYGVGHAWAQRRKVTIGRRHAQRALEGL